MDSDCIGIIQQHVVGSAVEANVMFSTSLVQTKLRAVVQTHVGVTEQAAGWFLQS